MILSKLSDEEEVIRWVPPLISPLTSYEETQALAVRINDEKTEIKTERDIDQEIKNAKLVGYQQGLAEAEVNNKTTASGERTEFLQLISSLRSQLTKIEEDTQQALLHFAFELGRTVIRRELQSDKEYYLDVIQRSCDEISEESPPLSIRLHPDDIELIGDGNAQLETTLLSLLVEDESLPRGSCLLETSTSFIDASMDSVIDRIADNHATYTASENLAG